MSDRRFLVALLGLVAAIVVGAILALGGAGTAVALVRVQLRA